MISLSFSFIHDPPLCTVMLGGNADLTCVAVGKFQALSNIIQGWWIYLFFYSSKGVQCHMSSGAKVLMKISHLKIACRLARVYCSWRTFVCQPITLALHLRHWAWLRRRQWWKFNVSSISASAHRRHVCNVWLELLFNISYVMQCERARPVQVLVCKLDHIPHCS